MASSTVARTGPRKPVEIPVRTISNEDLRLSLKQGLDDFKTFRGDIFFAGIVYVLIGFAAVFLTMSDRLLPLFVPVAAGALLLGPVAAVGFYELARRREAGDHDLHWYNAIDVRHRPSIDDIGIVTVILLIVFGGWVAVASILYAVLFGWALPGSIGDFLAMIFATPRGWLLIGLSAVIGAVVGWLVMALSVVSLPMLVDTDMDAGQALSTSWRATKANFGEMIRWGFVVTFLLILGSLPFFVGLAVVFPWLGYATWHLYTRLVDRSQIPARYVRPA